MLISSNFLGSVFVTNIICYIFFVFIIGFKHMKIALSSVIGERKTLNENTNDLDF